MDDINIRILAALRQQTNAIRELTQSVNSLRLQQLEQNNLTEDLSTHLKRQAM